MRRTLLAAIVIAVAIVVSLDAEQKPAAKAPATKPPVAAPEPSAPTLSNDDIFQMVQAGLGEAVILASVRTAKAPRFDLSPAALIALKKGGVSDAIVAAMIDPTAAAAPPTAAPTVFALSGSAPADTRPRINSATAAPEIPRDPGIYWDKGRDGAHDLTPLEPTVFSQGKTGGFFTSALTYGIKKINWKAVTRGSAANRHIAEPLPTFYFYFESRGSGLSNTGGFSGWLSGATSPNEFVLARMTSKAKERELIVGEMGAFGGSSGTRSKDTIDIQIDRLSGGVYRVKPAKPLEPGEYCFFYASGVGTLGMGTAGAGKLFDFGIYGSQQR